MIVEATHEGFYCRAGDFYIDPKSPVRQAVLTHAHSDHARVGSRRYITSDSSKELTIKRLGEGIELSTFPFGATFKLGKATVSLHPAGHILGSSQVRIEIDGEVWVVSGDYKRDDDPTCERFEVVKCDTFVTEATFALPIYNWPEASTSINEIFDWWMKNRSNAKASILFCYSLGKAQRVLGGLLTHTNQPARLHGAIAPLTKIYREAGIPLLETLPATICTNDGDKIDFSQDLIIAPPGANGTSWIKRFGKCSTALCSGWMQIRGNRRRRGYDRGFVLSDHADWKGLIKTIKETQANRILAVHGRTDVLVKYLRENGYEAEEMKPCRLHTKGSKAGGGDK